MINKFSGEFAFLSNFYPSPIFISGWEWPTVEHYYQAMKTTDADWQKRIRLARTPGESKRYGRKVILRLDWDNIKLNVMELALRHKFEPRSELAAKLLFTGNHELIEGNHWNDTFWGVCNGIGENHLGKLLMRIRLDLA